MAEKSRIKVEPDMEFINDVLQSGGDSLKKCFQCGTCSVVCNLSKNQSPFPRKEMIWAQWGMKDRLMADPQIWSCYQCADCSAYCPRGAQPGDVLNAIRKKVIEALAWPSFMGKALGDPHYWVWLFLAPALILGSIVLYNVTRGAEFTPIVYGHMIGHLQMNVVFPLFTGLAALAFLIGINRMWKAASGESFPQSLGKMDKTKLAMSVKDVITDIVTHKDFGECETTRTRKIAHLMVFYGFIGLLLTTALAIVVLVVYEWPIWVHEAEHGNDILGHYPMVWYHPVKWVGNASAVALIVGAILMVQSRRQLAAKGNLTTSYFDNFFLWIVLLVGVTGFLSQVLRFAGVAILAYPTYFTHLVLVFALLIYSPYSKFAHFVYRTVALIYNRYAELAAEPAAEAEPTKESVQPEAA